MNLPALEVPPGQEEEEGEPDEVAVADSDGVSGLERIVERYRQEYEEAQQNRYLEQDEHEAASDPRGRGGVGCPALATEEFVQVIRGGIWVVCVHDLVVVKKSLLSQCSICFERGLQYECFYLLIRW